MNRISEVQEYLKQEHKDAWIMVDYENRNSTLVSFLGNKMLTRKIFLVNILFPKKDTKVEFLFS